MSLRLADRTTLIQPSATMAMATKAKQLKADGIAVADFSLGEPDFPTPEPIRRAAQKAIDDGKTRYTPAAGIPALRKALAEQYSELIGEAIEPAQVVVSTGAKQAIHNAVMALCQPGDEVIIPAPYWVSYLDLVRLTGAEPKIVPTPESNGFKLTPEALRQAITDRTRVVMLNSPNNPTGTVYTRGELDALAEVVLEHSHLAVISDEIYEHLTYGDAEATCFASLRSGLRDRTITVSGASKTYAMTGWRLGWSVAPLAVAKFQSALQSQQTGNPCSITQEAGLEAVTGSQEPIRAMREEFAKRREYVLVRVSELPEVSCTLPEGAFYVFMNVKPWMGRTLRSQTITDSTTFCQALLSEAHVATVMGSAFGAEGYVRASFATDMQTLIAGFDAIHRFLNS